VESEEKAKRDSELGVQVTGVDTALEHMSEPVQDYPGEECSYGKEEKATRSAAPQASEAQAT
jgi:hypothetical protein